MIRIHIIFKGKVQGVGFRYETTRIAHAYHLTGWVKNLPDFSVAAEIQGDKQAIDALIHQLKMTQYFRIDDIITTTIPILQNESEFQVIYY